MSKLLLEFAAAAINYDSLSSWSTNPDTFSNSYESHTYLASTFD